MKNNNLNLINFNSEFNNINSFLNYEISNYITDKFDLKQITELFETKSKKITKILKDKNIKEELAIIEFINDGAKFEKENESDFLYCDRFLAKPMGQIAYGFIQNTLAGDGDPLDVMIVMPYYLAYLIKARMFKINIIPLFTITSIDDNEQDDKIIAIPSAGLGSFLTMDKSNLTYETIIMISKMLITNSFGKNNSCEKILDIKSTLEIITKAQESFNQKNKSNS